MHCGDTATQKNPEQEVALVTSALFCKTRTHCITVYDQVIY